MSYYVPEHLHADRTAPVIVHAGKLAWTASPQPGVERRFLERQGAEVAQATSIVRYAPGSSFPPHAHDKGEEYLVLEGIFSDQQGDFGTGTYVRNPPTSRHAPFTREGCVIFVKLRQMPDDERETLVRPTSMMSMSPTNLAGLSRIPLFERDDTEAVGIERLESGAEWRHRNDEGGEEILVLDGTLQYGATACPPLTWLRIPAGREQPMSTTDGCRYWVKRRHLKPRSTAATVDPTRTLARDTPSQETT